MIYGIAENPRPTGKCVKYTPVAWGLKMSFRSIRYKMETLQKLDNGHYHTGHHTLPKNNWKLFLVCLQAYQCWNSCFCHDEWVFHCIQYPLYIQPIVVVKGFKRQQAAALTNFVGCFLLTLINSFFSLLLSALNDLTGPSAGPLA